MTSHPLARGFLAPYRVLDVSDERGLLAGHLLAKMGADVIQVEPPDGSTARTIGPFMAAGPEGERSLYWSAYSACKRGITCDHDSAAGREIFERLVAHADFVIDSAPPGVMAQMGRDYAHMRLINPKIICVSITAYGTSGPRADYADSELTAWAAGGALLAARETGGTPLRVSVPQAFLHAAADGAGGALVAHFARVQSGCGQHVDISAQQSAAQSTLSSILSAAVGHQDYSYRPEVKSKNKLLDLSGSGARTRRSKWRVSDGLVELHLAMGPAAGRFTNNLFAWMFEEGACDAALAAWDWTSLPARIESDEIVEADVERARTLVADFLAPRSKQSLAEAAMRRKLLLAPLATVEDLVNSPHHRARGFFESVTDPFGRVLTLPGAFAMGPTRACVPVTPAPTLGQHNVDVYQGLLGLTDKEFAALKAAGAMG